MAELPPYDQLLVQARAAAAEVRTVDAPAKPLPDLRWRNTALIGGTALAIGAYGMGAWWSDGFTSTFRSNSECSSWMIIRKKYLNRSSEV